MKKTVPCILFLLILLAFVFVLSISFGSVNIGISNVIPALFNLDGVDPATVYIVRNIRLVRSIGAILTGAVLACCGVVFQTVFKNPMTDSFVLGISSCSSFCISFAIALGLSATINVSVSAFIGSLICVSLLFVFNRNNTSNLLLAGISVNFMFSALTTLMMYISRKQLDSIMFWTMGSLSALKPANLLVLLVFCLGLYVFTIINNQKLDLLLQNDLVSISSGLESEMWKILFLSSASICTAVTVSCCGIIGFIGLMSPHIARYFTGPCHKKLIPTSMLIGSVLLLVSDLVSRTIAAPSEIPVGIVTSIIGAPLFLLISRRHKG